MAVPKISYMSLEELFTTAAFRVLKPRPAEWVKLYLQEFIQTGIFDHNAATKVVYPSPIPVRMRSTAHRLRNDPKVKAVVKFFMDSAEGNLAADLAEIQKHLDACEPGGIAAQQLLRLKNSLKRRARLEGIDTEPEAPQVQAAPPSAEPIFPRRYQVGEVVPQKGVMYKITAVDENGQPTAATNVEEGL